MKNLMIVAAAGFASTAFAGGTTTYNDLSSFLSNVEPGFYDEGFGAVQTGAVPSLNFSGNGFAYTATSAVGGDAGSDGSGGLFNDPGLLSLNLATDALLISFTSGNVTAVGGDFFASDIFFLEIPADVTVNLNDGTSVTFNGSGFAGFTSDVAISSILIDASDATLGGPAWPTVDRLIVGTVVPAPGVLGLIGMGSLVATRRRR